MRLLELDGLDFPDLDLLPLFWLFLFLGMVISPLRLGFSKLRAALRTKRIPLFGPRA